MIKTLNPEYKRRVTQYLNGQHFMKHIDFDLNIIEEGRTEGWLDIVEKHKQQKGLVHGGVIATLADITAGFAAYTLVPEECHVVTGEIKVSYLNPGIGQRLYAKGWVLKQGQKLNFCEAEVWCVNDDEKTLIAKATTTMVTIFPEDIKR